MRKRHALAALGLGLGLPVAAHAQVVSFHDAFNYAAYPVNYDAAHNWSSLTYVGQGAYSDPGNNAWNGFGKGTPTEPVTFDTSSGHNVTSGGAATPVGLVVTYSGPDNGAIYTAADGSGGNTLQGTPAFLLGNAAVANGANPIGTFVLDHVVPGHYALYLYGANYDNDRGTAFSLSSGTADQAISATLNDNAPHGSGTSPASKFGEGTNYVLFTGVTPDANGTISGTFFPNPADGINNSNLSGEADFNGLQLVNLDAVPEPASLGMIGLGALALIRRRRR